MRYVFVVLLVNALLKHILLVFGQVSCLLLQSLEVCCVVKHCLISIILVCFDWSLVIIDFNQNLSFANTFIANSFALF